MAASETKQIAQLDERIKALDNNLTQLNRDFETFHKKLSQVNSSNLAGLQKEYESLQKRMNALNASQTENLNRIGQKLEGLSRSRRNDAKIIEYQNKLLEHQKKLMSGGGISSRLSNLGGMLSSVDFDKIMSTTNSSNIGNIGSSKTRDAAKKFGDQLKENKETIDQTNKSLSAMIPTLTRLASAFGVAFSVRGLVQFGKKLIETRGEFEMQFVAMKQIIGDVDAATKIWNQTMEQALKSPFKAMQLVDYTKKLAAYRIETEKLFDTTKRLADVSAGLGVDMGRLILAYGQVKAANFLRASEIRQFTEAGVNILGELAQYFSIVENRAVSTSDVMERVTKRMVLFSDVEAIFKRMTDEGGVFFNMQEVQANTVKGQIMKLHDAYDQMLNTIGQANQGTLRDMIDALNQMVRNWRDVASFIMKNVNALVILLPLIKTYRIGAQQAAGVTMTWKDAMQYMGVSLKTATSGLKKFSISTAAGTAALKMFLGVVQLTKTALKTFVPFLAIEGLLWLITKMQSADRAAKELSKTLEKVGSKGAQNLQENIEGFGNLVERLKMATEGSQNYLDIRNKIQNQYGEYLDNLEAEQITVESLADSYDRVVERMREKSRQHIMEEGMQEIAKTYGDAMTKFQDEIANFPFTSGLRIDKKEALDVAKLMYELYAKDSKYRGLNNPVSLLRDALETYYGADAIKGLNYAQLSTGNQFYKSIETRFNKQLELETQANALTQATTKTHEEYVAQLDAEYEYKKKIKEIENDKTIQSAERKNFLLQAEELRFAEKKLELQAEYQKKSDSWLDREKKKLQQNYGAFLDAYNAQVRLYIGQRFGDENWMQGDNKEAWTAYNLMIATSDRLSQGQSKWEEHILGEKKLIEENIERIKEKQATQTATDAKAQQALNEELKRETERLELVKKQMELLGLHDKEKKGGSANNSIYSERIKLLQDMFQKYKLLAKEAYSYAKAEGKVSESFEDAWKGIMPNGYGELDVPTSYAELASMLQRLETFTPKFDKNGELSKQLAELKKAIADALSQVDIEFSVKNREHFAKEMEQMFNNYQLTLDLEKVNLPIGELSNIFQFDITTSQDLRDAVDRWYQDAINAGAEPTNVTKMVQDYYKKIDEIETKELQNRLKKYTDYLAQGRDEAVKIHLEEVKKMAELDALYQEGYYTETEYKDIAGKIRKETDKALAKNAWQEFKESDFYVTMFEDLEHVSETSIEIMIDKLSKLRDEMSELDPTQVKEIVKAIDKLEKMQRRRRPLATYKDALKGKREWDAEGNALSLKTYTRDEESLQMRKDKLVKEVAELQDSYDFYSKYGLTADKDMVGQELAEKEAELKKVNDALDETKKKINEINEADNEGYKDWKEVWNSRLKDIEYLNQVENLASTIGQDVLAMMDGVSDATQKYAHDIAEIAGNAGLLAKDIVQAIYSEGTDVGAMIDGLVRTWNIIKGWLSAKERSINQDIEDNTNALKDYEEELNRVQRARERAWDAHALVQYQNELNQTIRKQRDAYDAMIKAEEKRKNPDEDLIRQWKSEMAELDRMLEDEKEKFMQVFGGIGESGYRDAAQAFVDAWTEAFLETGDGLEGLQDHFDEFLQEWFVKQATMRIAGRMLQPLFEQIDRAVDQYNAGGTSVLMSELNAIREKFGIIAPQLSDALEALAGQWGLGEGEGGLSGLAAGIQGMTEEQANILESYWNSVRGYTASIDMNVSRIVELLGAGGVNTNPQLQQLQLIAANAQATHQLLLSTSKSGHPMGGYGFKVFND